MSSVGVALDEPQSRQPSLNSKDATVGPEAPPLLELVPESGPGVEGVTSVVLDLVWEPPWTPAMMSEAAKLELGML